ncbi:hypothetical protein [Leucobacter japonicus]|uniref:hypothetical protein n=1 Tax=Leucobacter japonicus TaxID=1461259 RepID=UPI0006A7D268|nr:hypothetical protein [Leucobacter japonicus]
MTMNNTSANPDGPEEGRAPLAHPPVEGEHILEDGFVQSPEFGEADADDPNDPDPVANLE